MLNRKQDNSYLLVMVMGFSLICCVNVACFFPNSIITGETAPGLYRNYNFALGVSTAIGALTYGIISFRIPKYAFNTLAHIGYLLFFLGFIAMILVNENPSAPLAVTSGILCGLGIALTMIFWFGLLTFISERRSLFMQGCQALLGGVLFILAFSCSLEVTQIIMLVCIVLSGICAHFIWQFIKKNTDILFPLAPLQKHEKLEAAKRSLLPTMLPILGFTIISLLYGTLIAVGMSPEGSDTAALAAMWGSPLGAAIFLLWVYVSRKRTYTSVLQILFIVLALLLMLVPLDILMLCLSAGYQICGLLAFSLIIDELSNRRSLAILQIGVCFACVRLSFLLGLYVPGMFGVTTYVAFRQSTLFVAFLMYVVFLTLLLIIQHDKKQKLIRLEGELTLEREKREALIYAAHRPAEGNIDAACRKLGQQFGLTKRETEVLGLLAHGRDVAFICKELFLARNTVKGYMKRIYTKLNIHSKQELIDLVEDTQAS